MMLNFYPCSMCYRFHVQRTKQDLQYGKAPEIDKSSMDTVISEMLYIEYFQVHIAARNAKRSLSECLDVTCIRSNQDESRNRFGGFMKKLKIEQNYSKVRFIRSLIMFQLKFSVIKTLKLLLRLIVIKKNCPDQWSKISQLDGECKNDAVKEEVKGY